MRLAIRAGIVGQDAGVGRHRKQCHRGRRLVGLRASQHVPRAGEEDGGGDGQADQLPPPQNSGHPLWCNRVVGSAGTQLAFFSAGVFWSPEFCFRRAGCWQGP